MKTLSYTDELVVEVCWCGMHHAIPRQLRDHMKKQQQNGQKQQGIYCPLGHTWIFGGKSELERTQEQLDREIAASAALLAELDQERASHATTKGQLTKAKKRADRGVCQHCHRSFVNVARHVASQHRAVLEDA